MKSLLAIQNGAVVGILTDRKENRVEMVSHGFDVVTVSREVAAESYGKPWPDFETLISSHRRYEALRTLNPRQFADLYAKNLETGTPFDELVDQIIKESK